MTLTLGYKASAEQFAPRELVEIAVAAEGHGMESVWTSDHFQPWRHAGGHAPFSLTWMAAVGERTSTDQDRHERDDADVPLQPRRARAGVRDASDASTPTASSPASARARRSTRSPPGSAARASRTGPSSGSGSRGCASRCGSCARSGRGDRVSFEGEYYSTHDASIYDRPEGGVPVYIAAGGPTVAKYAGRAGDGFICTSGKGAELYVDQLIPAVKEGAEAGGRSYDALDRMIEIKLSYEETEEAALENTRFWSPLSLSKEQKHDITDPVEMERAADALPIEQIAKRWIVGTDPDEVVAQIGQYVDWGFNHLVFHAPGHDQRRFLELFERDLAPRLRAL